MKNNFFDPRRSPRSTQDRSKTPPRGIKKDAFFVLIFDSFWDRLEVVLGSILGAKIDPKSLLELNLNHFVFDLVVSCSQDGPKTVPRGLLGGSWAVLGGSWAALGGFWTPFGQSWGSFWIIWGSCWDLWGVRLVDSIHRFDSMMRFVDSIR